MHFSILHCITLMLLYSPQWLRLRPSFIHVLTRDTTSDNRWIPRKAKEIRRDLEGEGIKARFVCLRDCVALHRDLLQPLEDDCTLSWWIIHQSGTHRDRASSAIGLLGNVSQNVSINPPAVSLPALSALPPALFSLRTATSLNSKQHFISIDCDFDDICNIECTSALFRQIR